MSAVPDVWTLRNAPLRSMQAVRDGATCAIWPLFSDVAWSPRAWYVLDCDAAIAGRSPAIRALDALLDDQLVEVRGGIPAIAQTLHRLWRIIGGLHIKRATKAILSARCMLRLFRGQFTDIPFEPLPKERWVSYQPIIETSHASPAYLPAHVLWVASPLLLARLEAREKRPHFNSTTVEYVDAMLGLCLAIEPHVFMPDPAVVDLMLSAYLSPESPLKNDLAGARLAEPCTGSGILALAAATLGAAHVASTDIDHASMQCAQRNALQTRLHKRITTEWADGMPINHGEGLFICNPPWYEDQPQLADYFRCLVDPERRLLKRLLREAADRDMRTAYVFEGKHNPFDQHSGSYLGKDDLAGWRSAEQWSNDRGTWLHHLVRDAE